MSPSTNALPSAFGKKIDWEGRGIGINPDHLDSTFNFEIPLEFLDISTVADIVESVKRGHWPPQENDGPLTPPSQPENHQNINNRCEKEGDATSPPHTPPAATKSAQRSKIKGAAKKRTTDRKPRRGPGRPPKHQATTQLTGMKVPKIWEFIRDLLYDPISNPSVVRWEDREEGVFRFVKPKEAASMWGRIRGGNGMSYENMSRAMRYHYKSRALQVVPSRRLVYKFGEAATNWKPHLDS